MFNSHLPVIALLLLSVVRPASAAEPKCDRACLRSVTDQYLKALLAHDPALAPMADSVRYTENAAMVATGDGLWKTVASLRDHQQYYQDAVSGNALFRGAVNEIGLDTPTIVAIRIRAPTGRISEMEAIIARKGAHGAFMPEALTTVNPVLTQAVPLAKRASRAELEAIADSYWTGIQKHDSSIVQFQRGCDRFENGRQMTNVSSPGASAALQSDCGGGAETLLQIKGIPERRFYLFDEEHGIAIGTFTIDVPGTPASPAVPATSTSAAKPAAAATVPRMPLVCEVFKIRDGKIQYIEATLLNMPNPTKTGW